MPIPLSFTLNCNTRLGSGLTMLMVNSMVPLLVNLMLLLMRLSRICLILSGSPNKYGGMLGSMWMLKLSPLLLSCTINKLRRDWQLSLREKSIFSSSSLPASIFEKSRMSLMMDNRASPESCMVLTYCSWVSDSFVSPRISAMPMMPLSGVRISWLMWARNCDLAADAAAAACVSCSASMICFCNSTAWRMSR